jgi:hypothetical protein
VTRTAARSRVEEAPTVTKTALTRRVDVQSVQTAVNIATGKRVEEARLLTLTRKKVDERTLADELSETW